MGGFSFISCDPVPTDGPRLVGRRWIRAAWRPAVLTLALGIAAGLSPTASANPTPGERPGDRPGLHAAERADGRSAGPAAGRADDPAAERPVATRPDGRTASDRLPSGRTLAGGDPGAPALTRAAERARIESMTPRSWLAGFGPVSVERGR